MAIRRPCVAGQFYEGDKRACQGQIEECLAADGDGETPSEPIVGGIVPHAGWMFSGPTAGRVFGAIARNRTVKTFVLLGADHRGVGPQPKLFGAGAWVTPLGEIPVDEELALTILSDLSDHVSDDPRAHGGEHSLEVQVPFIQHLFPTARIVPITVPPEDSAHLFGERLGKVLEPRRDDVVVIGSTDLTHYGPSYWFSPKGTGEPALAWVKEVNDRRIVDLALELTADRIVDQARSEHSACGSGAMAATTACCRVLGCRRGMLLHYTTSHDVMPERRATSFVGYAGIVFPVSSAS